VYPAHKRTYIKNVKSKGLVSIQGSFESNLEAGMVVFTCIKNYDTISCSFQLAPLSNVLVKTNKKSSEPLCLNHQNHPIIQVESLSDYATQKNFKVRPGNICFVVFGRNVDSKFLSSCVPLNQSILLIVEAGTPVWLLQSDLFNQLEKEQNKQKITDTILEE
jgi:hypothetical protein